MPIVASAPDYVWWVGPLIGAGISVGIMFLAKLLDRKDSKQRDERDDLIRREQMMRDDLAARRTEMRQVVGKLLFEINNWRDAATAYGEDQTLSKPDLSPISASWVEVQISADQRIIDSGDAMLLAMVAVETLLEVRPKAFTRQALDDFYRKRTQFLNVVRAEYGLQPMPIHN